MNIWLLLFWSTWSLARHPDSATRAGLAHGSDYSYCIDQEQKWQKGLSNCFLECQTYVKKSDPHRGFVNPHPPDYFHFHFCILGYQFRHFACSCAQVADLAKLKNITEKIGANRGIANLEIILSFGPGTFWWRDEIPKWNFTIWAQVTYQQGKSPNWKCPLRGHILTFKLFLSMIDITDSYTYLLLVYLGDGAFETLYNFFLWHVSRFYSSYSKNAMPFPQQHSFYQCWNFMSVCHQHCPALWHCNLLMNVSTCSYWNQMTVAFVMYLPVLEDLFLQAD